MQKHLIFLESISSSSPSAHNTPRGYYPNCTRDKPQLAIIIDDMNSFAHYEALTQIPLKLTPHSSQKVKQVQTLQKSPKTHHFIWCISHLRH